jgi:hypothetical protein
MLLPKGFSFGCKITCLYRIFSINLTSVGELHYSSDTCQEFWKWGVRSVRKLHTIKVKCIVKIRINKAQVKSKPGDKEKSGS